MTIQAHENNVFKITTNNFEFGCDASEIGIPAGCSFPQFIKTTLGNRQPFVLTKIDSEYQTARYTQDLGCLVLTVFND